MTPSVSDMFGFKYFTEGKTRGAGHNRKVIQRTLPAGARQVVYTLHGHEVATLTESAEGYDLRLDNCGYTTRTTGEAIGEFIDNVGIMPLRANASMVWGIDAHIRFDRHITIPLDMNLRPVIMYSDFRIEGTKLHYTVWGNVGSPFEMAGEYVLGFYGKPSGIGPHARAVTKGYTVAEYEALKYIARAKTPATRETRLIAAVLRGEAVLHSWDE